jgi:hypothetical protein
MIQSQFFKSVEEQSKFKVDRRNKIMKIKSKIDETEKE